MEGVPVVGEGARTTSEHCRGTLEQGTEPTNTLTKTNSSFYEFPRVQVCIHMELYVAVASSTCSCSSPDSSVRAEASAPTCAQRWVSFFRYSISLVQKEAGQYWIPCAAELSRRSAEAPSYFC